ncbi:type II secretion system protein [Campylobacter gracilis]|uniref:Prepilin-type cleavage/methylation N-terminal domain protein n=2 Tax=Campylobacter TaxID=194 RepID=C8PL11_9BACT|nr:type II secretion system protein [Campylobacter gracilis]AKT93092.1 putative type II secretion system protein [Campylobacter gracilis]EEV16426.1 prepilin-type cleavage/methylation N-terminal domain protein [Campylobacter gracilis RM3268]UEB44736.1 type II secretion system GspH family protein [Campylobacter gracilis]SUW78577.1 prepilin-type N- terminal cleavage/methylation domain-containing protein [Campylobacter gracilis]
MKRGFTLIELVFVIVVLGIISMFGADLYTKIYKSYVHVRAVNQLEARTQNAMMLITNRLEDRIKSSTIGRELSSNEFVPISDLTDPRYDILEWIGQSVETRNINQRTPGWSGFMSMSQLKDSTWTAGTQDAGYIANTRAEFNMVSLGSDFPQVANIVGNLRATAYNTPSNNTQVAVIFKVVTNDASPTSVGIGFGYDRRIDENGSNRVLIAVGTPSNAGSGNIQGETIRINQYPLNPNNDNSQEFSEQYYIAHSAYAIVPDLGGRDSIVYTRDNDGNVLSKNFDLVLKYNYRPWSTVEKDAHSYDKASSSLLAEDVSLFRFKDDNGAVALKLCMRDDGRNFDPSELDLNVCKAQVVY